VQINSKMHMEGRENKKTCLARFQANKKTTVIKTVWYYHWRNQICQQNEMESSEIDSHKTYGPDIW